jgi:hypothetical protein
MMACSMLLNLRVHLSSVCQRILLNKHQEDKCVRNGVEDVLAWHLPILVGYCINRPHLHHMLAGYECLVADVIGNASLIHPSCPV